MKVYYISPSSIPSRKANSIHVVNMCEGLVQLGHEVILFCHSNNPKHKSLHDDIEEYYGVSNKNIKTIPYLSKFDRAIELRIAIKAFLYFMRDMFLNRLPNYIISRNLYSSLLLAIFLGHQLVYETHSPERGFRRVLQKLLISSSKVKTVVISNELRKLMINLYGKNAKNINVFHDAARSGVERLNLLQRKKIQRDTLLNDISIDNYDSIIGYFGHLYPGRGIEIIHGLAKMNSQCLFLVYGGNEEEINDYRDKNNCNNLIFMGHSSPDKIIFKMKMMDILLMPYQKNVSIGLKGIDTSKWMSPMKMFEYMSSGVPIISSDLTVLREILVNNKNCLLVTPDNIQSWSDAIFKLNKSKDLSERISNKSYQDYQDKYTWKIRAKRILEL